MGRVGYQTVGYVQVDMTFAKNPVSVRAGCLCSFRSLHFRMELIFLKRVFRFKSVRESVEL